MGAVDGAASPQKLQLLPRLPQLQVLIEGQQYHVCLSRTLACHGLVSLPFLQMRLESCFILRYAPLVMHLFVQAAEKHGFHAAQCRQRWRDA
jgi:hypothetical protein